MNKRQQQLLIALIQAPSFKTIKAYAQELQSSPRTLQSDLLALDHYLNDKALKVERKKGTGIWLQGEDKNKKKLLQELQTEAKVDDQASFLQREELVFYLLIVRQPQSIDELAERLFVSKPLARQYLQQIRPIFPRYQLQLSSKPGVGTVVTGDERKRRELLAVTLKRIRSRDNQDVLLKDFFSKDTLMVIQHIVEHVFKKFEVAYLSKYSSLTFHLYFMLERMKLKETVKVTEIERERMKDSQEQKMSSQIVAELSTVYAVKFSPDEIDYLALRINSMLKKPANSEHGKVTKALTQSIIVKVENYLGVTLHDDPQLQQALWEHLRSTYDRIQYGFAIANPLTKDILSVYTRLFLIVQMVLEDVFAQESFYLPQEEIAYLTIHFQAAIERQKKQFLKHYQVALITQYPKSMALFLKAKLEAEIPELRIVFYAQVNNDNIIPDDLDFILCTVDLKSQLPLLRISPLIENDDIVRIKEYLLHHQPQQREKKLDMTHFVTPFLVYPQLDVSDMTTLLEKLGQQLVHHDYVKPAFVQSLLSREARSSTKVAPLISLPHGDPRFVRESTISIATLSKPIDSHGEKSQLILLIALKKSEVKSSRFRQLFSLVDYLKDSPEQFQKILKEQDKMALIKLLSHYL